MKPSTSAAPEEYLSDVVDQLKAHWPNNRAINIVCHGHSVPAGYFATPVVNSMQAYPHLLHAALKERYPFAVINVIVTAIGGENSSGGATRFADEVLPHRPDVVTLDYSLNDRGLGLTQAEIHWREMIEKSLQRGTRVLLLTPTLDLREELEPADGSIPPLQQHAEMIRSLAGEYSIGLADSYRVFLNYVESGGAPSDLMSWVNHPNATGHALVATQLLRWFPCQ